MHADHTARPTPEATGPGGPARPRTWVPIRALHAGHRDKVAAHLLALTESDRIWRFGHAVSDEHLQRYAGQLDFERDCIFGTFDRRLELLTLGHLAVDTLEGTGEFGVSVLPRARGRGLGRQLFEHAVVQARHRSLHTLHIHLARDNAAMLAIVQRAGASIDFDGRDATAQLPLHAGTLGSHLEALIHQQAADIDFRVKRHTLRVDSLLGVKDQKP